MLVAAERHEGRVELTLGGCRRDELRDAAIRLCGKRYGEGSWRICDEQFCPLMVSRTGSVRLWEGHFELECASPAAAERSPQG
jgi:hypothetical protein